MNLHVRSACKRMVGSPPHGSTLSQKYGQGGRQAKPVYTLCRALALEHTSWGTTDPPLTPCGMSHVPLPDALMMRPNAIDFDLISQRHYLPLATGAQHIRQFNLYFDTTRLPQV